MSKFRVGIVGFGTVGKGIYKILKSNNDLHPIIKEIEITKVAVKNIGKKRDIALNFLIKKMHLPYQ